MEHIDKKTFKKIFHDHWEPFKAVHPRYNTKYYDSIIQKMLDCGDPAKMGYAQFRCTRCGETRHVAFSCKCTFCLSCAKPYTDRWIEFIGRRLLPGVVYRHFVFTMPDFLTLWFYRDQNLLSPLMRAGYSCLRDIFHTHTGVELDIGSITVLQTAGRPGTYNPHLHMLVSEGGITPTGKWKSVSYIPFEIIHRKWQYHLLSMMREHTADPAVSKDIDKAWKNYPKGFVAFLEKGKVPQGGQGIAKYLAKYLVSPPISVRRIEQYDGKFVRYWYRDHKTGQIKHETLSALQFVGRMAQHILPKGFQRIRYYGLHGNVRYEKMRKKVTDVLPSNLPPSPLGYRVIPRNPFAKLFEATFGKNPLLCPSCHEEMILELLYHPRYGTIRNFLKHDYTEYSFERPKPQQRSPPPCGPRPMEGTQRMVQISLHLM